RGVGHVVDLHAPVGVRVARDLRDGAVNVATGLTLGHRTGEDFTRLRERDYRWRGAGALGIRDHGGFATFEHGDHGVRGTEVNSDRSCHEVFSFLFLG